MLEARRFAMADLDWNECPAVESIPGKRSGAWVFKDTRTPASVVFENMAAGASIEEVMEWFAVTREQVEALLMFAARSLEAPAERATAEAIRATRELADAHTV
jgi:uncharacterized protein (DUF433 family)